MKPCITKLNVIVFVALMMFCIASISSVLSQERESVEESEALTASKWYYNQRAFPFRTIYPGAFENAINYRNEQRRNIVSNSSGTGIWTEIGPKPLYWNSSTVCTGRMRQVTYDPRDPSGNIIYITAAWGGVWKSGDGGSSWDDISGNLPTLSSGWLEIDPVADRNTLYFGSGDVNFYFGEGRGMRLFKSNDDGGTWTSISSGLVPGTTIFKIAISPPEIDPTGKTLFAATWHGLFKTIDGGESWNKIIPEEAGEFKICTDVCFSPQGDKVYAAGPTAGSKPPWDIFNGIQFWRSDDEGNSFHPMQPNGFPHGSLPYAKTLIAVSKADNDLLYLLNYDDVGYPLTPYVYVYKSLDGGDNFTSSVLPDNTDIKYHLVIKCSDYNPDIVFAGFEDLYRSVSATPSWSKVAGYYMYPGHPDFLGFDFNPTDNTSNNIIVGNDGGVFRSTNMGDNWTDLNSDLGSFNLIWGIASNPYDENFIAAGLHDYGFAVRTTNSGTNWYISTVSMEDGGTITASPFKSGRYVASSVIPTYGTNSLYYSSDGFTYTPTSDFVVPSQTTEATPFAEHPTIPGTTFMARYREVDNIVNVYLCKSTNYGVNWGGGTPWREFVRPSTWKASAPTLVKISPSSPNTMLMNFGNAIDVFIVSFEGKSRLIKSNDGGLTWGGVDYGSPLVTGGGGEVPNRFFTDAEFDPNNPDEIYLTLSGYYPPSGNEGHVFKSVDGGSNWENISGTLPDIPVNDIMIHYPDSDTQELLIATDAGSYKTDADNISWSEIGEAGESGFPNTPALKLDYHRLTGKLRVNTWGRGAWEYQLSDFVYIQDHMFITDDANINKNIIVSPGGKLTIGHSEVGAVNLYFAADRKITVEPGGQIEISSGQPVTLNSQWGTWGGIEIKENGFGTIQNCTFSDTETPISIEGAGGFGGNYINIQNCVFNSGGVSVSERDNVTISENTFNFSQSNQSYAISVLYGSNISISKNTINNAGIGLLILNSSPYIDQNEITTSYLQYTGMELSNSYSSTIKDNTISGYPMGISLNNSSPVMYLNEVTTGENGSSALNAANNSFPRLHPTYDGGQTIWDGGLNILMSITSTTGNGIFYSGSMPDIDYGNNDIDGGQFYIATYDPIGIDPVYYYMRCNTWGSDPPENHKFYIPNGYAIYEPYGDCAPDNPNSTNPNSISDNPNSIIANYGNGIYDTIRVTGGSRTLAADQALYNSAVHKMLLGDYKTAFEQFKQIIDNYRDSWSALNSLRRLIDCRDKMGFDSDGYISLRSYFISLAQKDRPGIMFKQAAKELAAKCLVRLRDYPGAITEYEGIIENSIDKGEVLNSELNIIETYMIMQGNENKDAAQFTGKFSNLKPKDSKQGYKMIIEKLNKLSGKQIRNEIPVVFRLSQNYPNPFNPVTKISYDLPKESKVTLIIYDILGREVKRLVNNENKSAGRYIIEFNAANFASGVYFYRIEAEELNGSKHIDSKKMVLVK